MDEIFKQHKILYASNYNSYKRVF